ncbi:MULTISPECIES: alpha/beta hydrolase [Cyanophyceae]|uniref:alpha/beta fold hydrolase n=1 Tax=Cyanophyceae TaxID=3028117 RepID=UPI001683D83C|nr:MULTISPECIES: alpha/beta hydrolase [Cyanophyceae]MBD1917143.1 alpha/beta hydrolase [Phormidium sp. FACHB-77]MBD2030674.1 alpha/beta hydrolase [Phormidium sp. FACHB-322]MBD2050218.1 alpha/beta hydrolase [Leptolyngbya sp. FACHB-60]
MAVSVLPAAAAGLSEPTSIAMAAQVQVAAINTPPADVAIPTAYVAGTASGSTPPLLLIPGFDSSLLEFRRLLPLLSPQAWAVDLLGFGFSDRTLIPNLSPGAIKLHLHSFWQQQIQRPVVLVGASMGGAAAIDFALTYPEAVTGLVLIDAAGFAAGPAMGNLMVPPLDSWATAFLRSPRVRRSISRQAYFDKTFVTADAELCAALHLQCPGWQEALIAFTKSGGYNFLTTKITEITSPTLVIWGEQDKILGTKDARRFEHAIPNSKLVWIPNCGHVPHLEKPQETAAAIAPFVAQLAPIS